MRTAYALRISSGKIILYFAFVALCGALQTHFHGMNPQKRKEETTTTKKKENKTTPQKTKNYKNLNPPGA